MQKNLEFSQNHILKITFIISAPFIKQPNTKIGKVPLNYNDYEEMYNNIINTARVNKYNKDLVRKKSIAKNSQRTLAIKKEKQPTKLYITQVITTNSRRCLKTLTSFCHFKTNFILKC